MLSAAHVLAMDAKNLLDVVDSVRIRYPDLFMADELQSASSMHNPVSLSAIPTDPIYGMHELKYEKCFFEMK